MKLFIMYVVGLLFIGAAIYFANPASHKVGVCAFVGIGLLVLAHDSGREGPQ